MFSFFKSSIEKDLIKLGFGELVNGYKLKVKTKEWTKQQYINTLNEFYKQHLTEVENINNVNVATRQSFDVTETIVPLNLQNIQLEYIDVDFLYSSLLFEYNNYQRIHSKALYELNKLLQEKHPDATISTEDEQKIKYLPLKELINDATLPFSAESKNYLKAVFKELTDRIKNSER